MSIPCSSNSHSQKKTLQFHEDRITNLPDNILHHILSFLPAKNAIATTLLSTKWKNLWFSIQNLQFHSQSTKNFIQFVSRVLLIHTANNPTINKFHLSITKESDPYYIYSWISEVLSRKVRELILDISGTNLLLLPSLFTSESLNVLKIDTIHCLIRFPPTICFSALKVLHLCFVHIGGIEEEIQHMFITCPVLEELLLLECEWNIVKSVTISAPVLKRLVVDDDIGCEDAGLYNCGIEIFTDNLVSFDFKSDFPYEYSLNNLSSMVSANVDVLENRSSLSLEMRCLNKLIRGIFHVKNITLSCGTLVALSRANLLASLATFPNLTNLRVNVDESNITIKQLMDLLCCLSRTEYIVFTNIHLCTFESHSWTFEKVTPDILYCLRSVEFKNYHGSTSELHLIKFLLKNARVLENVTLFIEGLSADPKKQLEINEQLQMLEAPQGLVKTHFWKSWNPAL